MWPAARVLAGCAIAAVACAFGVSGAALGGPGRLRELRVEVRSCERGAAIPGADVEVCATDVDGVRAASPSAGPADSDATSRTRTVTGADGVAVLDAADKGTFRIRVSATGFATALRTPPATGNALVVALGAGHTVQGSVSSVVPVQPKAPSAGPESRCTVLAGPVSFAADADWAFSSAVVDENGGFRLTGLPRGPIELWLVCGDQRPRCIGTISVPGVTAIPEVRPPAAAPPIASGTGVSLYGPDSQITGEVAVHVTDAEGGSVAGATAWISAGFAPPSLGSIRAVTGRDGRTSIPSLGPGVATAVSVSAAGFADTIVAGPQFDAAVTAHSTLAIRLDRRRPVTLRAVDAITGKPVRGAYVWAVAAAAPGGGNSESEPPRWNGGLRDAAVGITDDNGVAEIHGMPVAGGRLQIDAIGYRSGRTWVGGDAVTAIAKLQPSLDVAGRAVLTGGAGANEVPPRSGRGLPAAGVRVWLHRQDAARGAVSTFGPARTDQLGAFRFADVPEGQWWVVSEAADDPDVAPCAVGPLEAGRLDVVLELRKRRTVRGVVRDASGAPVVSAAVLCRADRETNVDDDTPRTDASGRFTSRDAPWGAFGAVVIADRIGPGGRQRRVVRVPPTDPGDSELSVTVGGGGTIRGVLLSAAGDPCRGVPIIAIDAADPDADVAFGRLSPWSGCVTDSDGRFEIAGLALTTHRLWLVWDWRDPPTSGGQAPPWLNKEVSPRGGISPGAATVTLRIPAR